MSAPGVPAVTAASDVAAWSEKVDVVVVGFGIAGGCAAVAAAESGARVLVLERAGAPGGTSALAGGHFYLGGGTAVQAATGFEDTPEAMADYLTEASLAPDEEKIAAYTSGSVEHFTWLEALGFEFERTYYPEKAVIQPGTQGLMYTGNEKVWPFRERAVPAPRGHKVPVPGETGGAALIVELLTGRADELGVRVQCEAAVRTLIVDDSRVVGVSYTADGQTRYVRAGGVILATGGFVMNREMLEYYTPVLAEGVFALGTTHDDGAGIRLGQSVGGAVENMDQAFVTAPAYPPGKRLEGVIVNKNGDRFVAEDSYHARTAAHAFEQEDGIAYLIVDSQSVGDVDGFTLTPFIDGWETVAEMETALKIPTGRLHAALDRYNEAADRGEDPDFSKSPEFLRAQSKGPWAAFDLSRGRALYSGFTLGGLRTGVNGQVLTNDGGPIVGLYAAGACASTLAQDGRGYSSGTQLGSGSFFGRRAGSTAAVESRQES